MKEETMTTTDLTLDERAAKVLGYVSHTCTECGAWGCSQYHKGRMLLPPYSTSIDAQHPLEEMARAQGWRLLCVWERTEGGFGAMWGSCLSEAYLIAEAPTEPEARLRCLLEVLEGRDD